MSWPAIISLVFVGGGIGSLLRFGVAKFSITYFPESTFPIGTLIANALACALLGVTLYVFKDKLTAHEWVKYFIVTGICGGFSTFSTFSYDTVKLFQAGLFTVGVLNILISLILGIAILWLLVKA